MSLPRNLGVWERRRARTGRNTRTHTHTHTFIPHARTRGTVAAPGHVINSHFRLFLSGGRRSQRAFQMAQTPPSQTAAGTGQGGVGAPSSAKSPVASHAPPGVPSMGPRASGAVSGGGLGRGVVGQKALDTRILSSPVSGARVGEAKGPPVQKGSVLSVGSVGGFSAGHPHGSPRT